MGAWIRKVTKKFIIFERLNKIATLMIIQPFHKMLAASLLLVSFLSSCEKSSKVNDDGSIDIVRNGKTAYSIVYNQETSKSICDNLVLAFEDLTGASPKVVTDDSRNSKFEIIVGNTGRTETAATLAKVGENGYAITVDGSKVVIVGSNVVWTSLAIKQFEKRILRNPIYLGHLIQLRTTTVSYKNHKTVRRDENDWAVTENNHEAIISQELWDRVREVDDSVSNGKSSKNGITMPLSGLCYCSDCGSKMKQNSNIHCRSKPCYTCGRYSRFGKEYCSSHTIRLELIESLVLQDIQHQIDFVMNEPDVRAKLLAYKQGENAVQDSSDRKRQHDIVKRIDELDGLIQSVYEDKVAGKVPEKVCIGLLEKYQAEKDKLTAEQDELRKRSEATRQDERDVDEYIRRMKSYAGAKKLTREMALELIEYIKVDAHPGHRNLPRTIHVFYKLIDKPLTNKRNALE